MFVYTCVFIHRYEDIYIYIYVSFIKEDGTLIIDYLLPGVLQSCE